jgi:adsorption protein B
MELWIQILRAFLIVAAVGFLISGLDDLFVDLYYYVRRLYRRWFVERKYPKLTEDDLRQQPEKLIAIMIPAWDEHAVIRQMLEHTLRWLDYRNYEVFVGTYPNDEATMMAVAAVQESDPRIHRIVCPHDGPTNKADCLNWVFEGIRVHEKETGKHYEVFLIHDSEDIVHPLSLKLMNYLIPRVHMVQLPVVPLEMPMRSMTAGTYLDEFAEFHTKDLLVRERVAGMIPSAGVGTGFSREALDLLAENRRNQLFNVETLTEDYDFGFRLKELNKRSILLQFSIERTQVVQAGWFRKREKLKKVRELVATREFFPGRFRDAVRQKTRWIFGIVFQGWAQIGWVGDTRMRYMIWRDRKALFSNVINIVGYILLMLWGATFLLSWWLTGRAHGTLPELVGRPSWLWDVIVMDTVLMLHRAWQRFVAVGRVSNGKQMLMSVPRMVWGNVINFVSVWRAAGMFLRWHATGQPVAWAKTAHAFPTEAQLREFKRKLGDLLLENRLLSMARLSHAMEVQKQTGERLGDVLLRLGYVSEDDLVPVLGAQLQVEARRLDPAAIDKRLLGLIQESAAREFQVLAVAEEGEKVLVAAADPGNAALKNWLEWNLRRPYRLVLAGRKNLVDAIDRAYAPAVQRKMLGELLLQSGVITAQQLEAALEEQKRSGRKLGEVLERLGFITPELLAAKIREQQAAA